MYLNCGQKLFKCYIYFHNIGDRCFYTLLKDNEIQGDISGQL